MTRRPDIHIIVAMTSDLLIGNAGKLPWTLPEDLHLFKKKTIGNTVIMGRKTYTGIGKVLADRNNIVITSKTVTDNSVESFSSFDEGVRRAVDIGAKIFCIGGREIFAAALPLATELHISWVEGDYEGNTYFPGFNLDNWQETNRSCHAGFTHISYKRKRRQN